MGRGGGDPLPPLECLIRRPHRSPVASPAHFLTPTDPPTTARARAHTRTHAHSHNTRSSRRAGGLPPWLAGPSARARVEATFCHSNHTLAERLESGWGAPARLAAHPGAQPRGRASPARRARRLPLGPLPASPPAPPRPAVLGSCRGVAAARRGGPAGRPVRSMAPPGSQ